MTLSVNNQGLILLGTTERVYRAIQNCSTIRQRKGELRVVSERLTPQPFMQSLPCCGGDSKCSSERNMREDLDWSLVTFRVGQRRGYVGRHRQPLPRTKILHYLMRSQQNCNQLRTLVRFVKKRNHVSQSVFLKPVCLQLSEDLRFTTIAPSVLTLSASVIVANKTSELQWAD